jgi:hypothetical protein
MPAQPAERIAGGARAKFDDDAVITVLARMTNVILGSIPQDHRCARVCDVLARSAPGQEGAAPDQYQVRSFPTEQVTVLGPAAAARHVAHG